MASYLHPPKNCYSYYLQFYLKCIIYMSKIQFDINIAIGIAIDVANNILPV